MEKLNLKFLQSLATQYPSVAKACTEIINLQAILNLPKETEHFVSDVHGEYEQFLHILKTGSGAIRNKIEDVFGNTLCARDKKSLAALIYYPEQKVERISETSFRYSFVSDESGTLYYGTYNFNGSYNWENNTPTGDQLVGGEIASLQIQMHSGYNQVEISYNGTDKDYFALPVDVYGNYAGYTEHDKIPAYVPQVPEEPKLAIESIFYNKEESDYGTCLDVTFTTAIDDFPNQALIKFTVIQGTSVGKVLLETSFLDESHTKLRMRTLNGAFGPGTYKVSMYVSKDGQLQKVEKEFIID